MKFVFLLNLVKHSVIGCHSGALVILLAFYTSIAFEKITLRLMTCMRAIRIIVLFDYGLSKQNQSNTNSYSEKEK